MNIIDNGLVRCECHECTHIRAGMGPGTIGWNPKPTPPPECRHGRPLTEYCVNCSQSQEPSPAIGEGDEMKVYCVFDDSVYPAKLIEIFAQKKDAYDFCITLKEQIVEEKEVIQ